jgi:hypothetical protein
MTLWKPTPSLERKAVSTRRERGETATVLGNEAPGMRRKPPATVTPPELVAVLED